MKKVGIITQPLISNYGGILQNYALQKFLRDSGFEVETIDRQSKSSEISIFFKKVKKALFRHHSNLIVYNYQKNEIIKESQDFIDKYIRRVVVNNVNDDKLKKILNVKKYDTLVVGSDQVWRPLYVNNIYNEYLDFSNDLECRKVSYAASFGVSEWEYTNVEKDRCRELVRKFDAVSVREDSGVSLCREHFNIEAEHVLDPTLLLTKENYIEIINNKKDILSKSGLYTYILDRNEEKEKSINFFLKELELEEFYNQPENSLEIKNCKSVDVKNFKYPSIEGWLAGFRDAEFVVTDSFHGTVFSIIFNKPFITLVNEGRGKARFVSLLRLFGLEDRLLSHYSENKALNILSKKINFSEVNDKLNILKVVSSNFLLRNV